MRRTARLVRVARLYLPAADFGGLGAAAVLLTELAVAVGGGTVFLPRLLVGRRVPSRVILERKRCNELHPKVTLRSMSGWRRHTKNCARRPAQPRTGCSPSALALLAARRCAISDIMSSAPGIGREPRPSVPVVEA